MNTAQKITAGALLAIVGGAADAAEFRVQAGAGYAFSGLKEDVSEPIEGTLLTATLENLDTGNGPAAGAAFWVDDWLGENVSVGAEYLYASFEPRATIGLTGIGGRKTSFDLDADAALHTFFVNAAWRQHDGDWHPYAGGGLGFGFFHLDLRNDRIDGKLDGPHAGVQAFIGLDYDLTERFYVGANARAYYVDGRIIDLDVRFLAVQLMANVGVRF